MSGVDFLLVTAPALPPYDELGGEAGVRALVDRFYDLMDTAPQAAAVRALHAEKLTASREKLFLYLSFWTGGPATYVEQRGHPRLRQRHLPFAIGTRERDEWLWCMERAMDAHAMPDTLRVALTQRFRDLADFMRNQPEAHPGRLPLLEGPEVVPGD